MELFSGSLGEDVFGSFLNTVHELGQRVWSESLQFRLVEQPAVLEDTTLVLSNGVVRIVRVVGTGDWTRGHTWLALLTSEPHSCDVPVHLLKHQTSIAVEHIVLINYMYQKEGN